MTDAIFTIGHSNRAGALFLDMLKAHSITLLADVRKIPRSRFNPQFNESALARELAAHGIRYIHMPALGGKREPSSDSPNRFFRAEGGLQSYADYMASSAFTVAMEKLVTESNNARIAVMCAEAKPENCHRQLMADWLLVHGVPVIHIVAEGTRPHALHPAAKVDAEGHLTYPAKTNQMALL